MRVFITILLTSFLFINGCKDCPKCPESESFTQDTVYIMDTVLLEAQGEETNITLENKLLYYQCKNILQTSLPEGYSDLRISSSSPNTVVSPIVAGTRYMIEPADKNIVLTFTANKANGEKFEWAQSYRVIKSPVPTIELIVNGKRYNGIGVFSKKSNCKVRIIPNLDFAAQYPEDAKYVVGTIDLMAQRSLGAPVKVGTYNGAGKDATNGIVISLGNKLRTDVPGTKIYFRVNNVYRVNSKNKKIAIPINPKDLIIGATIK